MGKMKAAFEKLPAAEKADIEAENDGPADGGRGAQEPAPLRTVFVIYDDGTTGKVVTTAAGISWARPGREVDEAEYERARAALVAGSAVHFDALLGADRANHRGDYDELRAAGISEGAARRMSGYDGEATES